MDDDPLKKTRETMKSGHEHPDEANSPESQSDFIQRQAIEAKYAKASATMLRIYGGFMLAGAIYFWYTLHLGLVGGLGIAVGLLIFGIFKAVYPGGIDPKNKIQRSIVLALFGVMLFLMVTHLFSDFTLMFIIGTISGFFLFGIIKNLPNSKPQV